MTPCSGKTLRIGSAASPRRHCGTLGCRSPTESNLQKICVARTLLSIGDVSSPAKKLQIIKARSSRLDDVSGVVFLFCCFCIFCSLHHGAQCLQQLLIKTIKKEKNEALLVVQHMLYFTDKHTGLLYIFLSADQAPFPPPPP